MKRNFLTYKEIHLNNFEDEERYDVRTQTNDNSNERYWKERDEVKPEQQEEAPEWWKNSIVVVFRLMLLKNEDSTQVWKCKETQTKWITG